MTMTAEVFSSRKNVFSIFFLCAYYRSSHQRCSVKKRVLKSFPILTGKHLCWSLFWRTPANSCFCYQSVDCFAFELSYFFMNWDSIYARLNRHYKAWNYEKKKYKKIKAYRKSLEKEPTVNSFLLILDLKPFRS